MELVSNELFKRFSPVKSDTDTTDFAPYVLIAQKLYTDKLLGDPLRKELETQILNKTLTPNNKALLEVLAPVIANYAVYQGLPFHWASIVNKGLTLRKSENSEPVGIDDVAQLRAWLLSDAKVFEQMLIDYLCKCSKNYPLWSPRGYCGNGCEPSTIGVSEFGILLD